MGRSVAGLALVLVTLTKRAKTAAVPRRRSFAIVNFLSVVVIEGSSTAVIEAIVIRSDVKSMMMVIDAH